MFTTFPSCPASVVGRVVQKTSGVGFLWYCLRVKVSEMTKGKKSKQSMGRAVIARISKEKYDELNHLLTSSRLRTMSELLRHILENRKVIIEHYDNTFDKVMAELSRIQKEIRAIGVNINQVTRKFHAQPWPQAMLVNALEITKLYQQTDQKVTELFSIIENLSQKWLPE